MANLIRLNKIIDSYKKDLKQIRKEEKYKWEAVNAYSVRWKEEEKTFSKKFEDAFKEAGNLLQGQQSPYKFIIDYAKTNEAEVKSLFQQLHDESLSFEDRYYTFKNTCNAYAKSIGLNSFQDLHAISVYFFFQYPEKYFIYKYSIFKEFGNEIDFFDFSLDKMSEMDRYASYSELCELIIDAAKKDKQLIDMHKKHLDKDCYQDPALHLLAQDIIFYINRYKAKEFACDIVPDQQLEMELAVEKIDTEKKYTYNTAPYVIKPKTKEVQGQKVYIRNKTVAINALGIAEFKCETDNSHKTFKRKKDGVPYTEPHHLIPMSKQDEFEYSIDIEENIVSLCSHCHNEIHYGENAEELITKLYLERKDKLAEKSIDITLEKLLGYYNL